MEFDLVALLNTPGGLAIKGALVAAFLDFAVGSAMAVSRGTFALDALAAFVRKHLLGRVFPIAVLIVAGSAASDAALTAAGLAAAAAYYAETIGSVLGSISPPQVSEVELRAEELGDPVPFD